MIALLLASFLALQDLPQHGDGPVNDLADEIDKETRAKIEKAIVGLKEKADVHLVVATVPSLQGLALEDYSIRLAKKWGVGEKGKNNGILLLHAPKERKIRIENGYGAESRLTDIESKGVINRMVPVMKAGKFAAALLQGVEDIARILSEKEPEKQNASTGPPAEVPRVPEKDGTGIWILMGMLTCALGAIAISIWWSSRPIRFVPSKAKPSPPFPDSAFGMNSAMFTASQIPRPPSTPYIPPIYTPPPPRPKRRDTTRRYRSSSSDSGSSSSSDWGSSSSSSDSSSFGGGDFGGGGASGDY